MKTMKNQTSETYIFGTDVGDGVVGECNSCCWLMNGVWSVESLKTL